MVFDATVPPIPQECAHNDADTQSRDLYQMTKVQLYELAQGHGVEEAKPNMRKAELIELLEEAGL